ncbi:Uncharacterized protein TCM_038733 [Theobroma cacao]|uniref:Uncharacterized protein n=1 Tax=Theobroma cacao TaxID=3641 RepID=A0A061GX85_THECC|nr:Uncharacterized protein TCM_038733 [Theobroma cacao]
MQIKPPNQLSAFDHMLFYSRFFTFSSNLMSGSVQGLATDSDVVTSLNLVVASLREPNPYNFKLTFYEITMTP